MSIKILYRKNNEMMSDVELKSASHFFNCVPQRTLISKDDLVICRYSCLPYYKELEIDVNNLGGKLINTYHQHLYAANVSSWYLDLEEFTPKTYFNYNEIPDDCGPLVVKGSTNSKKFSWKKHMFAENKLQASNIAWSLSQDALIGYQDIVYRHYVPLREFFVSLSGYPVVEEYRFFICHSRVLCGAYYWSNHTEELKEILSEDDMPNANNVPKEFLDTCIRKIGSNIAFYTLDIARTKEGKWIVIEINDGQMSGLSDNSPENLYKNLKKVVCNED